MKKKTITLIRLVSLIYHNHQSVFFQLVSVQKNFRSSYLYPRIWCKKTSAFTKKFDLFSLKPDVHKLYIAKLTTVQTRLNKVRADVDKLDVTKLQIAPVDLKKLSEILGNYLVKRQCVILQYQKLKVQMLSLSCNLVSINCVVILVNKIWKKTLTIFIKKYLTLVVH